MNHAAATGALRDRPLLTGAAIAVAATVMVSVWLGLGLLSLPGLLLLLLAVIGGGVLFLGTAPGLLAVLGPALMPLGLVWIVFPYEMAFGVLALLVVLRGLELRAHWLLRLERLELANLTLVAWALFTGFWCTDPGLYFLGARRFLEGAASLWVAYRFARLVPRRMFELGLVACSIALSTSALARYLSRGLSPERVIFDRASATNLGWGTANFIATLLLILTPPIIVMGLRARERWLRGIAWPTAALNGLLQGVIASRAATLLFFGGLLTQFTGGRTRRHWLGATVVVAVMALLLASPLGQMLIVRFQNPRELGSMVVRVWYAREAWQRTLVAFPWGLGVNQGLAQTDHLQNIDPHNYWLVLSSELGLPGVLLWIVILVLLWRRIGPLVATPEWHEVGRALQIAFWLSQLHTLVEPTFQGPQYQYLYFWVLGGYLGYYAVSRERTAAPQRGPAASNAR
ncbi:MAG: hypothetical protein HZC42_07835 [Candidatus Eisenbacteria bacterium]|nr:hypothetical protein [Candidatus Eisenbacteria bacterium]